LKKNLKYSGIFLLTFLMFIASCKKDEDKTLEEQLIGKWELESAFYQYYENGIKTGEQTDIFNANESVYEFIQDGSGNYYSDGTKKGTFTWNLTDPGIKIEFPNDLIEGNISIKSNTMTLEGSFSFISGGTEYESFKTLTYSKV